MSIVMIYRANNFLDSLAARIKEKRPETVVVRVPATVTYYHQTDLAREIPKELGLSAEVILTDATCGPAAGWYFKGRSPVLIRQAGYEGDAFEAYVASLAQAALDIGAPVALIQSHLADYEDGSTDESEVERWKQALARAGVYPQVHQEPVDLPEHVVIGHHHAFSGVRVATRLYFDVQDEKLPSVLQTAEEILSKL